MIDPYTSGAAYNSLSAKLLPHKKSFTMKIKPASRMIRPLLLMLAFWGSAHGGQIGTAPYLVRDINSVYGDNFNSISSPLCPFGHSVVFCADSAQGRGLWISDGTAAGTRLLKNGNATNLVAMKNLFFFAVERELWKSDGTPPGTVLVKKLTNPNAPEGILYLANLNGKLLCLADGGPQGCELWTSDGTAAGTVLVKDAYPGQDGFLYYYLPLAPDRAVVDGSRLFIFANPTYLVYELWVSDGTAAGTRMIRHFDMRGFAASEDDVPHSLTMVNGRVFFTINDGVHGRELWSSDGTAAGTVLVKDIRAGAGSSTPWSLTASGKRLFFIADDGVHGIELWSSDGTAAGTALVRDIVPGSGAWYMGNLANLNGTLFFVAAETRDDHELWKSDGTAAGTVRVKDLRPGPDGSDPSCLTAMGGRLYFFATDGKAVELWRSDGTAAGTVALKTARTDFQNFFGRDDCPDGVNAGGRLFFNFNDGIHGHELWTCDGSAAGTSLVMDISPPIPGSDPMELTDVGGTLYFTAYDNRQIRELWQTDRPQPGASPVRDPASGSGWSGAKNMINQNGALWFMITSPSGGEVWIRDRYTGTLARARESIARWPSGSVQKMKKVDGNVYLGVVNSAGLAELWKTNGTAAGTLRLAVVGSQGEGGGLLPSIVDSITPLGSSIFFIASNTTHGLELWKSGGTPSSTAQLKDIWPGAASSYPQYLTSLNGTLFFTADDGTHGRELWKSNGTAAGTVMVRDFLEGKTDGVPWALHPLGQSVLFDVGLAPVGSAEAGLWKSDGTAAGTIQLKPGFQIQYYSDEDMKSLPAVAGGQLIFCGYDGEHGSELWRSDGTAAGTVLVKDINPGAADSWPKCLTGAEGKVYFSADGGLTGEELWVSDGTASGTRLVYDISPGLLSSMPTRLTRSGDFLFFSATNRATSLGMELFGLRVSNHNAAADWHLYR